jgi:DNA-binding response OmpR family regulator
MADKTLTKQVKATIRQRIISNKVVKLADFRVLQTEVETRTILVVDDDEAMRNGLKRILESEKFKVITAADGIELSRVLESTPLELILLDVNLPWVDGFKLCELIQSHKDLKKVPLVFVSASKHKDDIERGFAVGASDYVTKPFDADHIISTIDRLLEKKSG